jgi:hypothetical protein
MFCSFNGLWLHFAEGGQIEQGPEDYDSMRFERELEKNQVGVGGGI